MKDGSRDVVSGGWSRELIILAAPLDYFQANFEAVWYSVPMTSQRGITKSLRRYWVLEL